MVHSTFSSESHRQALCGGYKTLFFLRSGHSSGHAQQNVDTSGDGTLPPLNEPALVEPSTYRRAKQGIEAICTGCHQHVQYTQEEDLSNNGPAARINKLRQKGIEEERCFGIEQVHEEAPAK